ncbi:MAG: conjugal transfer protein TrbE [Oricola sp.]|nr:MAG: conjugal transfer protein TrbE [Oricola sp.]
MMHLAEYRTRPETLADYLPWAALVAPGIVLNKDGSLQRSARFRGPDLESATPAELMAVAARLNNTLRRLGSGWAVFFEAERHAATGYPQSSFPDPVSWLVDEERRAAFEQEGAHYESDYHVTFAYLPPAERTSRAERMLLELPEDGRDLDYRDVLDGFVARTDRVLDLLSGFMPEVEALDDAATLTFLHAAISTKRHPVAVPDIPFFLDGVLADMPMVGGLEPMLGEHHLRTVSVRGFPGTTWPGLLDELNHLAIAYRWSTRFLALDKPEATNELTKWRRQWFAKRKGVVALLRETIFQQETPLVDTDAENKALDADAALQELGADDVAFGHLTTTITVWDRDRRAVDEKIKAVERVVNGRGFVTILETLNAVDAWLGSLPGHCYANVRQPIVSTLNLAHMVPMSAVWAGPVRNEHLDGPPLIVTRTTGATPFRLSTHAGDVGHALIVGPTGAGKSVLLSLMALQWRRYRQAQIFLFDKGASCRAVVLGMGGEFDDLGAEDGIAFQPLAGIDRETERAWAAEWIAGLIAHEKVEVTPDVKEAVWSALTSLASAPRQERTITGLSVLLQSNTIKQALQPYTLDGPFGRLLDADADRLGAASVQCFEMEELMHTPSLVLPVLTYLFHRLEARFDGKPTLLVLDEAWVFLDDPLFAGRIREWLKTLRKKNVAVIFATQSLSDISGSSIAPALIESCPTRIFLPNERAIEPQEQAIYRAFGMNDRQIELIARATPKRDYYVQTARGNRLFELGLGPIALAFCGASDKPSQALIAQVLETGGRKAFADAFLRAKGLAWAADLIAQHDSYPQTEDSP